MGPHLFWGVSPVQQSCVVWCILKALWMDYIIGSHMHLHDIPVPQYMKDVLHVASFGWGRGASLRVAASQGPFCVESLGLCKISHQYRNICAKTSHSLVRVVDKALQPQ